MRSINSRSFMKKLDVDVHLGEIACAGAKTKATMKCMLDLNNQKYIEGIGALDISSIAHVCKAGNKAKRAIRCIREMQDEFQRDWVASKSQSREMAIAVCAGGNSKEAALDCMRGFRAFRPQYKANFTLQQLQIATLCGGGNSFGQALECYEQAQKELPPPLAASSCAGGNKREIRSAQTLDCVNAIEDLNQPSTNGGVLITTFGRNQAASLCSMLPTDTFTRQVRLPAATKSRKVVAKPAPP